MRLAVLSDLHLGDELCTLVRPGRDGEPPRLEHGYGVLRDALRSQGAPFDYLVLLGDILDLSVAPYSEVYACAQVFFRQLALDGLAAQLIYVPGNHDFDVWNLVEHDVNVRLRIESGQAPRAMNPSVPCVVDARPRPGHEDASVYLHRVKHVRADGERGYGGLFFNRIAGLDAPPLNFLFAYPNLYLVLDDDESILLTHGHYLEPWWAASGELAVHLSQRDALAIPWDDPQDYPNLRELVGVNFPLNQLACSGVGQADPLSRLFYRLKREVNRGEVDGLERHLGAIDALVRAPGGVSGLKGTAFAFLWRRIVGWLRREIDAGHGARYDDLFVERPRVKQRFHDYYAATMREIREINRGGWEPAPIPPPSTVIFGHTHQPIAWRDRAELTTIDGRPIRFCNTGGWALLDPGSGEAGFRYPGAEIVCVDTRARRVESVAVSATSMAPLLAERAGDDPAPRSIAV